jgi:methylmalonyl-CoA/ethylmalonyl-CoA epimerase
MTIHHIGIACADIEQAVAEFRTLHNITGPVEIVYDDQQNASLAFIQLENSAVEFVSGTPVKTVVEKGMSYYHVCYEVEDLERTLESYLQQGAVIASPPKPAVLFKGRRVAFVQTFYGLVELLESKK